MTELKEIPRVPDFEEFLDEEKKYYIKQLKALEEIDKLEGSARNHAHDLLMLKDKETSEYKYTPFEVLEFINDVEA